MPEAVLASLRKPNPAVMATVTSSGRPVSVATRCLIEDDGHLMLCMNADRARLKHLQNNGHVSLTVLAADDFGTHVSAQGHVVSIKPDEGLADIDRLARHFPGKARSPAAVVRSPLNVTRQQWRRRPRHGGEFRAA